MDFRRLHQFYKKHLLPSIAVQIRVDGIIDLFGSAKVIGVVFRHPSDKFCKLSLFKAYFQEIDKILITIPGDVHIFLYTDTDIALHAFQAKYTDKLIIDKNCQRSDMDNIIQWGLNNASTNTRESSIAHGVDVITNTICLSKCYWLVATLSNIYLTVNIMNPDIVVVDVS